MKILLLLLLAAVGGCGLIRHDVELSAEQRAAFQRVVDATEIAHLRIAYLEYDKDPQMTDELLASVILEGLPGKDKDGNVISREGSIKSLRAMKFMAFMKAQAEQLKRGNISRSALRYKILEENEKMGREDQDYFARNRQARELEKQTKAIEALGAQRSAPPPLRQPLNCETTHLPGAITSSTTCY